MPRQVLQVLRGTVGTVGRSRLGRLPITFCDLIQQRQQRSVIEGELQVEGTLAGAMAPVRGRVAFLEFETHAAGKYINGVDIISCNDAGLISEFKVMIRPLQAVNLLHQKMAAMLEKLQA